MSCRQCSFNRTLRNLIRAIHPRQIIQLKDVFTDIREARNASVGHPTELKREGTLSAHGIVQHSMCKDGFELLSYPEKDGKVFQYVPVLKLIEKQQAEAVRILSEVVEDLREQEEVHRSQFREVKLMAAFDQNSYAFEKLFEEIRGDSVCPRGNWAVKHLRKSLDDFEKLLKARDLSLDSYDPIKYRYDEIEHPLTELTKFMQREPSEIVSNKTAVVFLEALQSYFKHLRQMAGEIDEEYSSKPDQVVQPQSSAIPITVTITPIE